VICKQLLKDIRSYKENTVSQLHLKAQIENPEDAIKEHTKIFFTFIKTLLLIHRNTALFTCSK